jgi:hypothetical protein
MTALRAGAGALLILWVLTEAFEALVMPRRVTRPYRLTPLYYRTTWRGWSALAGLLPAGRAHESFLSVFGPLSMLALFALWALGLIVGFALLQHPVGPKTPSFADALYFSGSTFTTLGYGDVTPEGPWARLLAVLEACTGLGFFAVVVAYLPVLYQAVSSREGLIVLLDARAGSPPAAGRLLLRAPPAPGQEADLNRFLEEAERWAAEVLESHLSFPMLGYYRSQHDNQSWLAALTCALDASALLLTVVEGCGRFQARLTFAMARHVVVDLDLVLRDPPRAPPTDRLPEGRLRALLAALRASGATVREDEGACARLAELRGLYEPFVVALAAHFRLALPDVWPESERPDNWQTSAWMRRAGPLTTLGRAPEDDHFV